MKTDLDAPRGRVVVVDLKDPAREKWREVVPQGPDAIQEIAVAGGRVFVHRLHDVSSRLEVFSPDGKRLKEIALPGLGTATIPTGRWGGREAFYTFQSFVVPRTTYRYEIAKGDSRIWVRDLAPIDSSRFEVHQVWYPSKDGTKIPMFLVHRQGLKVDGDRPTLLYGYGGFDVSLTPTFNPTAVWLAEQ